MQRLAFLACYCLLLSGGVSAQQPVQPAVRPFVVSPVVGDVIDRQEKATYGLFIYYPADNFVEARFEQGLLPDSTVQLRTVLRDGRTVVRPFTTTELAAVRQTIEARQQELASQPPIKTIKAVKASKPVVPRSARWIGVVLKSGVELEGELLARYHKRLEFLTLDSGLVVVERADIARLEPRLRPRQRVTTRFDVGNGHRLFLVPTGRNLRRGEGYIQQTDGILLGASYGITDYFSMGVLFSVYPALPVRSQFLLLTPKLSTSLSEKWYVGGGMMYTRIPKLDDEFQAIHTGIGYGAATYGSADNNVSAGLGYGIGQDGIDKTPVLYYGAQKRISRSWSLVSENFLLVNSDPGALGLFGVRYATRRCSAGLGGIYALPFSGSEDAFVGGPIYLDFVFRFGKGSRYTSKRPSPR
jgi:hypothetical protein